MSDNESKETVIKPCLAVTVQNNFPFEIKPNPNFWGDLASSLSTGPPDCQRIEDALKGLYCLALKSAIDNNAEDGVHLHLQETLAVPISKLCKVFVTATLDNGNQTPVPEDLTTAITSAVKVLQGVFLDGVTKAINKLNNHSIKLGDAITLLQEQVTMLQAQVPTPLTRQGSHTQQV